MASLTESASAAQANQLNRELLRWIQSLDLAYSIKNVKRDFANGFLVAEILSRYYDKDVSMHSFDNGIGVKVKKDNWDQLLRLFTRVPDLEPLASRSDVDAVIHCANGAAVAFVTRLYQCLTKRTILPSLPPPPLQQQTETKTIAITSALTAEHDVPPYAKPTGAAVIREKMRGAELAEAADESEIHRKVRGIHAQHEEQLQLERLLSMQQDPSDRYPSLRSASKATVLRSATRPVRNDDVPTVLAAQQVVKEVQIKALTDKSLEKLRMHREAKDTNDQQLLNHATAAAFDQSSSELLQKRRPMDLLNEAVGRALPPTRAASLDLRGGRDKFEALLLDTLDDAAPLAAVLHDDSLLPVLAAACLEYPREFAKLLGLLLPVLAEHDANHAAFLAVHTALAALGRHCVQRDATASLVLLLPDCVLPKLTPLLLAYGGAKRAPLLALAYAFAPRTALARLQVLKRLREAAAHDVALYIHALAALLPLDAADGVLDDMLVDLYHYYCGVGLDGACDKLRAACLAMLAVLAAYDAALVAAVLPRLARLASKHAWWEVKAQLLVAAAAFLRHTVSSSSDDSAIELALSLVEREFHPTASVAVRRVGLGCLAPLLSQYQELVPLFVDVLLSLPLAVRVAMLSHDNTTTMPLLLLPAQCPPLLLPLQWDAVAVAKQVFYERKGSDRADVDAIVVLHACLAPPLPAADAVALFAQMKSYLALGLLDAAACGATAQLLLGVARHGHDVLAHDVVSDTLQLLATRHVDDLRQQTAVKMLHDMAALGPRPAANVAACVEAMAARCDADAFRASLFAMVAADLVGS